MRQKLSDHRQLPEWHLEVGAEVQTEGVRFRVWAPQRRQVEVVFVDEPRTAFSLQPEGDGYFSALVPELGAGVLYRYRLDGEQEYPDPCAPWVFTGSKLDFSERTTHASTYLLHQDLLRLRRDDPLIARQDRRKLDGAVLGSHALAIRFFGEAPTLDRLLLVNLGADLEYKPAPEPLLAPVNGGAWRLVWSSDDPRYGGPGIIHPYGSDGWRIPGASAILLAATP